MSTGYYDLLQRASLALERSRDEAAEAIPQRRPGRLALSLGRHFRGDAPAALALLEDIKSTPGLEPDAESYHLTLLALVRSGNLVQADELIERMGYQDIEVGAQTLHQIAHYHLNCGNLDPAMAIVRDLEATGDVIPFHLSKRLKEWDS